MTEAIDRLSPKRRQFVREYVVDCNATQAAIRAGYSVSSAHSQAHDLLKNPEVRAAVDELQQQAADRLDITRDTVVDELWQNHLVAHEGVPILDREGNPTGYRNRNLAASNKALDQISELLGFKMERKAVVVADIMSMSDTQLDDAQKQLEHELAKLEVVDVKGSA